MRSRHPGYFLAAIFFTAMAVAGEVHLSGQVVAHASNGESWVIDAGPASTIWQPETSVPLHGLVFHGDNAGKLSFTWKVIAKPAGAEVTIAHPADLQTTARLQQPGDYRFELVAASGAAIQRDYVNATLFAPRAPARAYQPYLGGRYQPVPDYPPEWKAKYFPPVEMHYQHQGHLDDAFGKLPEPFVHPRLFVSPDELFDLRLKLKTTDFGRKRMARIREAVGHKAGTIGPWENEALATKYSPYQPFFPVWDEARQRDMPGRGVAETMLNESFRCLIDADAEGARRVAAALTVTCEGLLEKVLQPGAGNRKNWQDFPHGMMGRFAIPIIYDFVHPWMTDAQRKVVRDCIAEAAGGRWSIGMGGVNALNGNSSNWIIWITGDLFLHHAAIYREDGFDEKSYHEIVALFQRFYTIGWFEEDGDPLEAIGKQAFSMNKFLPLIRGGKPWDASLASYHFHAKYQLGLLFPWGTEFLSDEWLGGPTVVRGDGATLLKQSYPEDRLIDFMFRNAMGEDYAGGIGGIYNPTIELISNLNPNDVQGPKDFIEHIKWVEEKTGPLPLSYFARNVNTITMRSSWHSTDALFLYFRPARLGGHRGDSRGKFELAGLGRYWSMPNKDSGSVVHIDGRGSWKNNASLLEFKASPDATFAAADLKAQYMQTADDRTRFDDTLIAPSRFAWGGLPFYKLSDWRTGRPTKRYPLESWPERDWKNKFFAADEVTMKNGNWMRPAFPMEYAFRTAGLVREEHPFAMIIDDIRQDGVPHDFAWRFFANATLGSHRLNPLPKAQGVADLILFDVGPKLVGNKPDGSKFGAYDYTLREQPDHGEKVLLLRFLETPSGKIDQVSFHPAKHPWIDISSRSVEGGYKTILLPMRYGVDPLPETRWSDPHDRLTIAFAGRKPRTVYFEKGADQRTRVAVDTPIEGDVQVRAVSHRVAETDQRPLQFEFIRAGNVERDCLIEYAMDGDVDGDDLELPLSGAITIAKGKRSAILSVGVKQDRKKEDLEEVRIRIVKADGSVLPQHHTLARARAVILDEPRDFNSLLGGKGKKGQ